MFERTFPQHHSWTASAWRHFSPSVRTWFSWKRRQLSTIRLALGEIFEGIVVVLALHCFIVISYGTTFVEMWVWFAKPVVLHKAPLTATVPITGLVAMYLLVMMVYTLVASLRFYWRSERMAAIGNPESYNTNNRRLTLERLHAFIVHTTYWIFCLCLPYMVLGISVMLRYMF